MINLGDNKNGYQGKNISSILNETAETIIKELSGGDIRHKRKLIDNMVSFIGTAGGVGTSTIVANLAYTVSRKGLSVLVVDLNIPYPIQHNYFGIKQEIDKNDLVTFLTGRNSIGESLVSRNNISVLVSSNRNIIDNINCDTEICSKNIDEGLEKIRVLFDLIIVDCPNNIQIDTVNTVIFKSDAIYTVWDENIQCISNAERLRKNMEISGIPTGERLKAILNKRTSIHYPKRIFDSLEIPLISTFPFELEVIESGLRGQIFCEKGASMSKNARFYAKEMSNLAQIILEAGGYRG